MMRLATIVTSCFVGSLVLGHLFVLRQLAKYRHTGDNENQIKRSLRAKQMAPPSKGNIFYELAVATRIHFKQSNFNDASLKSLANKISSLCKQVGQYSELLLIAIDAEYEQEIKDALNPIINNYDSTSFQIEYVVISPWIGYTAALNGIIRSVSINYKHIKYLSFQSMEISMVSSTIIDILMTRYMDENTLVCGPKLKQQMMDVDKDRVEDITGANVPWNTLNIWNLESLKLFGFSMVSDGIIEGVAGGIEEVITISMIQHLNGVDTNQCKLVIFDGDEFDIDDLIKWDSNSEDNRRNEYNAQKLKSKAERASGQLSLFRNLEGGKVQMIIHERNEAN